MLTEEQRLISLMMRSSIAAVRKAVKVWAVSTQNVAIEIRGAMLKSGFEEIQAAPGAMMTDGDEDKRPVYWVNSHAFALPVAVFRERREQAFSEARASTDRAKNSETKSVAGSETLAAISCPKCQDALLHSAVCPKCEAGRAGYGHRYTCVCGVDFVTRDKL